VARFRDAQEVYATLGAFFGALDADPELGPRFREADTVIRYVYRKPDAQITIRMAPGQEGQVDFGPSTLEPEVTMTMDADVAHRFWLGKVNVPFAIARGQIRTSGPVAKVLGLAPLVKEAIPRYRAQLEAAGRRDLL